MKPREHVGIVLMVAGLTAGVADAWWWAIVQPRSELTTAGAITAVILGLVGLFTAMP